MRRPTEAAGRAVRGEIWGIASMGKRGEDGFTTAKIGRE